MTSDPRPSLGWQIASAPLLTRWAKTVTPDNAWREYPRPQMVRREWQNLNGLWEYGVSPAEAGTPPKMEGEILVPFPVESALSGVQRPLQPEERLWYRRRFSLPPIWQGRRILLHFGAVDWEVEVHLNGESVGRHRGGYLPFWFDISSFLQEGENELVAAVRDPTDAGGQPRGKQVLLPKSIWYTAVSGIWQTVWLEPVPEHFITGLKITPDPSLQSVHVEVHSGSELGNLRIQVLDEGIPVAEGNAPASSSVLEIPLSEPKTWSPASPHLYDLIVETDQDRVESYFGLRTYSLGVNEQGHRRLCLNHQPLFQYGPLDQGYWPDGIYTPPSEAAMLYDLQTLKRLGCNMLRKHVKVEPARYYYACDRLGLIVWQDMPNGGKAVGDVTSLLTILFGSRRRDNNYRYAGREDVRDRENFQRELADMVDHLHNFACIGMWVPFNEGWGQFDARAVSNWLQSRDPTCPVDHASGWFDQGGGNCNSLHVYFKKLPRQRRDRQRATILSEFGGYSLKLEGHLWNPAAEFGYRKFETCEALTQAYLDLLENELKPWIARGLSAAVYTQTTDVEIEINGFLTYDRAREKMDFPRLAAAHRSLSSEMGP